MPLKLVCISDTHCQVDKIVLPEGDTLIHAGDLTHQGTVGEVRQELLALKKAGVGFKSIILVPGNHDFLSERHPDLMKQMCEDHGITYLHDSEVTIDSIKFYGSGWTPIFFNWALMLPRGPELKAKWDLIPEDTDVLITHCPPHGILDEVKRAMRNGKEGVEHAGCADLRHRVSEINPTYHVFGHLHGSAGQYRGHVTHFINASSCTEAYAPLNPPIVVEI